MPVCAAKDVTSRRRRLPAAERRRQILDQASALFARRGFSAVTVKELAAACDINEAMLYRHFRSKEEIYLAVLREKIHQLDIHAFLSGLDRNEPIDKLLEAVALHILSIGSDDPEINRLLLFGTLQGSEEAKGLFRAWRQPFVDFVQQELARRMESGELRKADPHITARSFIGMVMDCSVSCFLWPEFGYEEFNPPVAVANNVGVFARGLANAHSH
jgi:AcrR family transcriptional regulator